MATLNETIEQVQNVFNDIEGALQEQGVNTENLKPVDYANAVRGIVNNISVENVSFLPVMIFCYSSSIPTKPIGGNWIQNEYTNQITPPEGWYLDLNDIEDTSIGQDDIYMSVCIFKHDNTKYLDWTTPVRISGKDGKDGKTGKQGPAGNIAGVVVEYNTPLYTVTTASQAPDKPNCIYDVQTNSLSVNSEGWSLNTPDENSLGANILWQSIARYYSDKQTVVCSNPVRISAGNPDVFRENGFYTEYCITKDLNGAKTEWFTPASADPPVPTLFSPFLWARDIMNTTVTGKHVGPVYLFATYSAGLIGIDVSYACAPSKDALDALDESLWFNDSASALTPDTTKEYQGLTEDTKYLWAREQFLYSNKEPDIQYRIVSTFTAAEKAAIIYSAGTFNEKVKYTRTEEQTPYVFFADGVTLDENNKYSDSGKKYYYFVLKYSYDDALYKIIPTNNTYPSIKDLYISSTDSNKKCNWEKMESFDAIYSDIGVFKAANVGQFVFDDKYIFSQQGVDKTGAPRNYTEFSEWNVGTMNDGSSRKGIALAIETGEFIPNILLNAVDGSGKLAGGNISWNSNGTTLFGNSNDGYMQIQGGKLKLTGSIEMGVNKNSLLEWGAFSEVKNDIDKSISDLQKEVTSTITSSLNALETKVTDIETGFGESVSEINSRLDRVVENHFYEGAPTMDNYPTMLWNTDEEKRNHVGDTYTNIATTGSDAGKSWRWTFTDNEHTGYHWHPIADTDAVKALLEASKAQATADGKSRTFVSQPIPPYSIGDLWVQGASGDIKRCKFAKLSGSYIESDWENASKYTDDAKANAAQSKADTAHELAAKAEKDAASAQGTADTALSASFSEAKKQELAKSLGYSDYDAFLNSENKIIKNGYINTGLINADAIVTDELISSKIAAATIAANSVKTTSASSVGSCELDGSTFKITGQDGTTFIDIGEHSSDYFDENKDNGIQNSIEETPSVSDSGTSITWCINGSKLTNASTIKAQIFKSGDTKCKLTISSLIFRVKYQMGSANNNWVAPVWKHWSTSNSTTNWNLLATDSYKPYLLIGSSTKIYPNSVTESEIPSSTGGTENTVAGKLLKFDSVIDVPSNTSVYLVVPANGINIVKFYSINNRSGAYTVNCSYTYSSVSNALISGSNGTMISSGKAFILAEDGKIETCGISNMGLHVGSGDIYGKYLSSRHILITDAGDTTVYLPELSETKPGDFFELWIGSNPNAKISTGDQYYLYANEEWTTLNGTNNLSAGIYKCMRADSSWWLVKY